MVSSFFALVGRSVGTMGGGEGDQGKLGCEDDTRRGRGHVGHGDHLGAGDVEGGGAVRRLVGLSG